MPTTFLPGYCYAYYTCIHMYTNAPKCIIPKTDSTSYHMKKLSDVFIRTICSDSILTQLSSVTNSLNYCHYQRLNSCRYCSNGNSATWLMACFSTGRHMVRARRLHCLSPHCEVSPGPSTCSFAQSVGYWLNLCSWSNPLLLPSICPIDACIL